MCLSCQSLLHNTAEATTFMEMATETYEKVSAYADLVSVNLNEVNLTDVYAHAHEELNAHNFKLELIDFDDEPLVKSEMVETVLTEDVNLKVEGIEDDSGGCFFFFFFFLRVVMMVFVFVAGVEFVQAAHESLKPYMCSNCNIRFGSKFSLTQHMRVHTSDRLFICYICNRAFRQKGNLKQHILIHR